MTKKFVSESDMPKINPKKLSPQYTELKHHSDFKQHSFTSLNKNSNLHAFKPEKNCSPLEKIITLRMPTL